MEIDGDDLFGQMHQLLKASRGKNGKERNGKEAGRQKINEV